MTSAPEDLGPAGAVEVRGPSLAKDLQELAGLPQEQEALVEDKMELLPERKSGLCLEGHPVTIPVRCTCGRPAVRWRLGPSYRTGETLLQMTVRPGSRPDGWCAECEPLNWYFCLPRWLSKEEALVSEVMSS